MGIIEKLSIRRKTFHEHFLMNISLASSPRFPVSKADAFNWLIISFHSSIHFAIFCAYNPRFFLAVRNLLHLLTFNSFFDSFEVVCLLNYIKLIASSSNQLEWIVFESFLYCSDTKHCLAHFVIIEWILNMKNYLCEHSTHWMLGFLVRY